MKLNRKLRMGMIGGGRGAFIGAVHRMAARLDGEIDLVAGCFSSDPAKSRLSGEDLFLNPSRVYATFEEMARKEAALPADQRIDFVSVVTRNNSHFAVSKTFLEAGFHVICDKPLCFTLKEGLKLRTVVQKTGKVFALTHNYTGYPMVKEAREWVRSGKLGKLMKIVVDAQSEEILGAAILGTGGDEAIHCILDTMYAKAPYSVLKRAMHIHPTVSELIPTILGELEPSAISA